MNSAETAFGFLQVLFIDAKDCAGSEPKRNLAEDRQ